MHAVDLCVCVKNDWGDWDDYWYVVTIITKVNLYYVSLVLVPDQHLGGTRSVPSNRKRIARSLARPAVRDCILVIWISDL